MLLTKFPLIIIILFTATIVSGTSVTKDASTNITMIKITSPSSSLPIIEAKSIKNGAKTDSSSPHKVSLTPITSPTSAIKSPSGQVVSSNSKRFGDLSFSRLLRSKVTPSDDPTFGFPIPESSVHLRTNPMFGEQKIMSSSSSSQGGITSRLRSLLPFQSKPPPGGQVAAESSMIISSVDSLGNQMRPLSAGSSPSSSSSSSSSELGLQAGASQLLNWPQAAKLANQDQITSFEKGFMQQQQQHHLANLAMQQQQQQLQQQQPATLSGTSSIFRKLVENSRKRIPTLSLLRPSAATVAPGGGENFGGKIKSHHKLFSWPYKLTPPAGINPEIPKIPKFSLFKHSKLFNKQNDNNEQQFQIVGASQGVLGTTGTNPGMTKSQSESSSVTYKPHLHFIEGQDFQTSDDDDHQYPKDNEPILPSQPEDDNGQMSSGQMSSGQMSSGQMSSGQMSSGQMTSGQMTSGQMTSGQSDSESNMSDALKTQNWQKEVQIEAMKAITQLLDSQSKQNVQSLSGSKILKFQSDNESDNQSKQPKTYHEYLLQQQKQQQLVEAAKSEVLQAAQNYAINSGLTNVPIQPVKMINLSQTSSSNQNHHQDNDQQYKSQSQSQEQTNYEQQQQSNYEQQQSIQMLQQSFNDLIASNQEESRNMPVVYNANQQTVNLPRRLRKPVRPRMPPVNEPQPTVHLFGTGTPSGYNPNPNGEQLDVSPSGGNSEIQFVRLPVQETPESSQEELSHHVMYQNVHQPHGSYQNSESLDPNHQQMIIAALQEAPRPQLPPHVSLRPEVAFIRGPSHNIAFFPPTISNHNNPGYNGLDTSSSAHYSHGAVPNHHDQLGGHYELIDQQVPQQQIPIHLLAQHQGFQGQPPHTIPIGAHNLRHQGHLMTHQLHPQHPGLIRQVVFKEQIETIAHQPALMNHGVPQQHAPPANAARPFVHNVPLHNMRPITAQGMSGWIPKDVPTDWTPGGPLRSENSPNTNDDLKFTIHDRLTSTRTPEDVVQMNHNWTPNKPDFSIQVTNSDSNKEEERNLKKEEKERNVNKEEKETRTAVLPEPKSQTESGVGSGNLGKKPIYDDIDQDEDSRTDLKVSTEATSTINKQEPIVEPIEDKYVKPKQTRTKQTRPLVRVTKPATSTTTSTVAPETIIHEDFILDQDGDKSEILKDQESKIEDQKSQIEEIKTKRHLFERINLTTIPVQSSSVTAASIVTSSSTTTSTTTATPEPVFSSSSSTTTSTTSTTTAAPKISRRNSGIILSSIDIQLGPKSKSRSSVMLSALEKAAKLKDAITWV